MLALRKFKSLILFIRSSFQLILELIKNKNNFIYAETFYPERERKSIKQIWIEQICHIVKYGQINKQYFEYGIDVKGVNDGDYLDNRHYIIRRNSNNNAKPFNYLCLVKDKKTFAIFGKYYGFPIWDSIGVLQNGIIKDDKDVKHDIREILTSHKNIFVKPIDGGGGDGTFRINFQSGQYYLKGCSIN